MSQKKQVHGADRSDTEPSRGECATDNEDTAGAAVLRPPGRVVKSGQHGPGAPPTWTGRPIDRLREVLKLPPGTDEQQVIAEAAERLARLLPQFEHQLAVG